MSAHLYVDDGPSLEDDCQRAWARLVRVRECIAHDTFQHRNQAERKALLGLAADCERLHGALVLRLHYLGFSMRPDI